MQGWSRLDDPTRGKGGRLIVRQRTQNNAERAAGGGWLVLHSGGELSGVFLAQSAGLAIFGLINAAAVAGGVWFGRLHWPSWPAVPISRRSLPRS